MRKKYNIIKKYRFVQTDGRTLQVDIVSGPGLDKAAIRRIIADLKAFTRGLEPTVRILDHIYPEPSGKLRIVKSQVTDVS